MAPSRQFAFSGRRASKSTWVTHVAMATGFAPASPPRKMDFEDIEDLEACITKAATVGDGALTGFEVTFVADFANKYSHLGSALRVTVKQWAVLKRMADKLGVRMEE